MLFKTSKSVKIVIKLGKKQLFYPKILDFMQKQCTVATFVQINLPKKPFLSIN